MHSIWTFILAFSLLGGPAFALDKVSDEKKNTAPSKIIKPKFPEPKTFKEAYAGYLNTIESNNFQQQHYAKRAFEFGLKKFGKEHINTLNLALNWMNLIEMHWYTEDPHEYLFKDILPYFIESKAAAPSSLMEIHLAIGNYYIHHHKYIRGKLAQNHFDKAIRVAKGIYENDIQALAELNQRVGEIIYTSKRIEHAWKYFLSAGKLYSKNSNKYSSELAYANYSLARAYLVIDKIDSASKAMILSLKYLDEHKPNSFFAMNGHALMIKMLERRGKRDEATKHCQMIGKNQKFNVNQEQIPLYRYPPKYPRTYKQGYVNIEYTIDEEGFVKNPKVIDGENKEIFSKTAITAIKGFRYAPRFVNGEAVSTEKLKLRFTFTKVR